MTWTEIASVATAFVVLLNFVWTVVWAIQVRRQVKASKRDEVLEEHRTRITEIETVIKALPKRVADHDDVEKLHDRISGVREIAAQTRTDVTGIRETLNGVSRNVNLLMEYHMPKGGATGREARP